MKTATLRDLRYDFAKIEAWLRSGEEVEITKRSKPLCVISPSATAERNAVQTEKVDFEAFREKVWGDRCFSTEEVAEARFMETGEP